MRLGNALYWFLTVLAWLLLVGAAAVDVFKLWGVISLSQRWALNSIAVMMFFLIWLLGRVFRDFLAGR